MSDVTEDAREVVEAVRDINDSREFGNLTLTFLADIFKGSDIKKIRESGLKSHPLYGRGKSWNKSDVERLLHHMVLEEYLQEDQRMNEISHIPCAYVELGPKASVLATKEDNIKIQIPTRSSKKRTSGAAARIDGITKELQHRCCVDLTLATKRIAGASSVSPSSVVNTMAIRAMSRCLPETEGATLQIPYVTKANVDKYGKALLAITRQYAAEKTALLNRDQDQEKHSDGNSHSITTSAASHRGRKIRKIGASPDNSDESARRGSSRGGASTRRRTAARGSWKGSKRKYNASTETVAIGLASFGQTKR